MGQDRRIGLRVVGLDRQSERLGGGSSGIVGPPVEHGPHGRPGGCVGQRAGSAQATGRCGVGGLIVCGPLDVAQLQRRDQPPAQPGRRHLVVAGASSEGHHLPGNGRTLDGPLWTGQGDMAGPQQGDLCG